MELMYKKWEAWRIAPCSEMSAMVEKIVGIETVMWSWEFSFFLNWHIRFVLSLTLRDSEHFRFFSRGMFKIKCQKCVVISLCAYLIIWGTKFAYRAGTSIQLHKTGKRPSIYINACIKVMYYNHNWYWNVFKRNQNYQNVRFQITHTGLKSRENERNTNEKWKLKMKNNQECCWYRCCCCCCTGTTHAFISLVHFINVIRTFQ